MENKFLAFDYQTSSKILISASKIETNNKAPLLYVFAGPNGSGKSTLISNKYENRELNVKYVNADINAVLLFENITDEEEKNKQAMLYTMKQVDDLIENKKSFVYETVLSHPSKLALVKKARDAGYEIISTFVFTNDPKINIERVKTRVRQGGHAVPEDKIESRYFKSLENSEKLSELSDAFYKFDNSENRVIITKFEKNL